MVVCYTGIDVDIRASAIPERSFIFVPLAFGGVCMLTAFSQIFIRTAGVKGKVSRVGWRVEGKKGNDVLMDWLTEYRTIYRRQGKPERDHNRSLAYPALGASTRGTRLSGGGVACWAIWTRLYPHATFMGSVAPINRPIGVRFKRPQGTSASTMLQARPHETCLLTTESTE